ncbi:PadR family transcriptional regulator [Haloarculaceae archaeon H-GB2-1]|nr:PadR family transcriptional regulator [Haloarculaceae archaeon H-GB1-1]MEA5388565.1 PadR family transcriptional regulator [Haloarculaceae archaeon H-GB11]MEA5406619.1 PadR family transcriptional regulator [Haloarculaceae archaeon H-GB2-1]
MDDLTGLQRDLLFAVAGQDDPHYLAIKQDLQAYYEKAIYNGHDREFRTRRLFPNLDTLIEKELVERERRGQDMDRYHVTDEGYRVIDERHAWERERVDR